MYTNESITISTIITMLSIKRMKLTYKQIRNISRINIRNATK